MANYVVLLGPPGAGKGTQAEKISETYHLTHVSTGDIFRENIREKTALGVQAQDYINRGCLVPDSLTIAMVRDRLNCDDCKNGALLDGFPRTLQQAEALDALLKEDFGAQVNVVPCLEVDTESLVSRISGRRMCPNGHVFHIVNQPPVKEGICDICGEALYQRKDDCEETLRTRLQAYHQSTAPLIDYYEKKGVLFHVDGNRSIHEVTEAILAKLESAL